MAPELREMETRHGYRIRKSVAPREIIVQVLPSKRPNEVTFNAGIIVNLCVLRCLRTHRIC